MDDRLAVWLYGDLVAIVDHDRGRPRLRYTDVALARHGLGSPLLSLTLPLTTERYTQGLVGPFLDGLLPEGDSRRAIADDFNLRASDTYGLIRAIGRDCAGAIVIQPADEHAPPPPSTLNAERLDEAGLTRLVAVLRTAPLGVDEHVRISLAGVQEKLLLTRLPDGTWGRPIDGTPSTHILKPEIAAYRNTVENEAFCMRLARELGLPVASVETAAVGGRKMIVVERYDRMINPDASVERLHQEDFCQATGVAPLKKYEEDGGPSLLRIATILHAAAGPDALDAFLRAVTLNAVIGNGDAHAKNFSLLHHATGSLTLAPLYDLMCTQFYRDDRLAMYIDAVQRTSRLTADRIANEAVRWGLSRRHAAAVINDVLSKAPTAIAAARHKTANVPPEMVAVIEQQLQRLGRAT